MPAHNNDQTIIAAARSVLTQEGCLLELIIINDGSQDDTAAKTAELAELDDRVCILTNKQAQGAAAARNLGLDHARGDLIAFLDADDLWHAGKLNAQIDHLKQPGVDFSFTSYDSMDEAGQAMGRVRSAPNALRYQDILKTCAIGCSSVVYRRSAFPEQRFPAVVRRNDYAMWLAMLRGGKTAYGLSDVLMSYRVQKNSLSSNKVKAAWGQWRVYRDQEKLSLIRELTFLDLIDGMIRHWVMMIILMVLGVGLSALYVRTAEPGYTARLTLIAVDQQANVSVDQLVEKFLKAPGFSYASAAAQGVVYLQTTIQSRAFARMMEEKHGFARKLDDAWGKGEGEGAGSSGGLGQAIKSLLNIKHVDDQPGEVLADYLSNIEFEDTGEGAVWEVSFDSPDPHLGGKFLQTVVEEARAYLRADALASLDRQAEKLNEKLVQTEIRDLRLRLIEMILAVENSRTVLLSNSAYLVMIVDPADPPSLHPSSPRPLLSLAGGLALGRGLKKPGDMTAAVIHPPELSQSRLRILGLLILVALAVIHGPIWETDTGASESGGGDSIGVFDLYSSFLIALFLPAWFIRPWRFDENPVGLFLLFWLVACASLIFNALWFGGGSLFGLLVLVKNLQYLLCALLVYELTRGLSLNAFRGLIGLSLLAFLAGHLIAFDLSVLFAGRLGMPFKDGLASAQPAGFFLGISMIALIALRPHCRNRIYTDGLIAVSFVLLYLTFSRTNQFALIAALAVLLLARPDPRIVILGSGGVLIAIILAAFVLPTGYKLPLIEYLADPRTIFADNAFQVRIERMWLLGWDDIWATFHGPLIGLGLGTYRLVDGLIPQLFYATGLIGLGIYLLFLWQLGVFVGAAIGAALITFILVSGIGSEGVLFSYRGVIPALVPLMALVHLGRRRRLQTALRS
ncbi:tuaG [Symbiodinium microadriaticum]|nr:tuaG [Symbiodinium microadriaticum]